MVAFCHKQADDPSSWFGIITSPSSQPLPFYEHRVEKRNVMKEKSGSMVFGWNGREKLILHLCSGLRRAGDFHDCVKEWCEKLNLHAKVTSVE